MTAKFVTFPPSLDSETGRWLVSHYGVEFKESPHALPFVLVASRLYGQPKVPVLVQGKEVHSQPKPIFEYLEPQCSVGKRLAPAGEGAQDEIATAWRDYNVGLGTATAAWAYTYLLRQRNPTLGMITRGSPFYEVWFNFLAYPLVCWALRKGLGITPQVTEESLGKIRQCFERTDALLADGRKYLVGDRFSIVDLTFAVGAAPVVLPPQYGGGLPTFEQLPDVMRPFIAECQSRPTGKYALRVYQEHRHA